MGGRKWGNLFRIENPRSIYIYSVLIGFLAGLVAVSFSLALSTAEHFTFELLMGIELHPPPGEVDTPLKLESPFDSAFAIPHRLMLFFLPILGGLLVGFILQFFYREASGAGTDQMIEAFHQREGKIQGRGALFKAIGTIITLASGGSGGREGPTAYIGAALGSRLGSILKTGARARRTLLLAGTAGGLGAIFRAPLGGAMTAVEIIYREDIESDSLVPCLISSVVAYLTFTGIAGPGSLFEVGRVGLQDYRELFLYVFLGLLCYGVGFIYAHLLNFTRDSFKKLPLPLLLKPALGGLGVGTLALFVPEVIGSGMSYLHETINGRQTFQLQQDDMLSWGSFFLLLAFMKIVATSFSIGSGGSGGLFAPSLFIGAMLGGSVASFGNLLFPDWQISTPSFMLVGMGSFFSGVARTPFSAMIMVSDIIGSYILLPPLMIVSMITFTLSSRWSIYRGQVYNRFKSPAHFWDMRLDILNQLTIDQQFKELRDRAVVSNRMLLSDLEELSFEINASDFVVVDENQKYGGMVSLKKVRLHSDMQLIRKLVTLQDVAESALPTIKREDSLAEALRLITEHEIDKVAVVDPDNRVEGYIRYHDIFRVYNRHIKTPRDQDDSSGDQPVIAADKSTDKTGDEQD